jgi:branched-chain amino acid transport system permease protein
VGVAVAIITATVLGVSIEPAVYRPLRRIGASQLEILLSSLGLYVVIENLIIILWQSDPRAVPVAEALQRGTRVGLVWVTGLQAIVFTASLILWAALVLFLSQTKLGKAIRALAADPEMTEAVGINEERMRLLVFGVGSVLAGVAVVFAAIDTGIAPAAGMNALLVATIAVIVGGTTSISGWVAGGFLIGVAENVGIWKISSEWKQAIAFGVLVVCILLRPQGLFGPRWAR